MLNSIRKIGIIVGTIMLLNTPIPAIASETDVVIKAFKWFNHISSENRPPFSKSDVAKHFSEDAKMITNNKLVCEGVKEHYDHFVELNNHYQSLQADVDSIDMRKAGDRIYLHYVINAKDLNNQKSKIHVMGYMVVKNERIILFNEIIHKELI